MKKLFIFALLFAFLSSTTLAFAEPKDKDLKINRGKLKKVEKLAEDIDDENEKESEALLSDLDDNDPKGKKSGKNDDDTEFDKQTKKTGRKLLKGIFK